MTVVLKLAVGLLSVVVVVALCVLAVRRTRAEPRRLSNGVLIGVAGLAALELITGLGVSGSGVVSVLIGLLLVLSPLLIFILAVLLIMNGVQVLRRESHSLGNLLALLLGLGLLFLCALPIVVVAGGGGRHAIALTGLVLIMVGYYGFALANFLIYSAIYRRIAAGSPADWVIVLGSGLGEGSRVTPLLASRISLGIQEAARTRASVLVMSGGKGEDELLPEAEAMAGWALERGVDRSRVMIESRSRNTEQNLRFSSELLEARAVDGQAAVIGAEVTASGLAPPDPARPAPREPARSLAPGLIVTSNYHAMRAAMLARRLHVPAQAVGAPTAGYYWPSAVIREFVAVLAEHPVRHLVASVIIAVPLPLALLVLS